MYALAIPLLLAVEHGVLVLRQHLGLGGHGLLPDVEGLEGLALLLEGAVQGIDDGVDGPELPPLPRLLEPRESPRYFPVIFFIYINVICTIGIRGVGALFSWKLSCVHIYIYIYIGWEGSRPKESGSQCGLVRGHICSPGKHRR